MNLTSIGINTDSWCQPWIVGGVIRGGSILGPAASLPSAFIWIVAGVLMLRHAIRSDQWKPIGTWQPATLPADNSDPAEAAELEALREWIGRVDECVAEMDAWLRNHREAPMIVKTGSGPNAPDASTLRAATLTANFAKGNVHIWGQADATANRRFIFVRSSSTHRKVRIVPSEDGSGWQFYSDSGLPLHIEWTEDSFLKLIDDLRANLPGWNSW
jgi:hypothetical protein